MRIRLFFVFVVLAASLAIMASGCAARCPGGSGWFPNVVPPILTIVLVNNTVVPLEVYENGQPISYRDTAGKWHNAILAPGGVVERGYHNFLGRRNIIITVRGMCPVPAPAGAGCVPGQYAGTASRDFYIYTDGRYHADRWEIRHLYGPRGVY